jgi:trk system potassium uptake protein
LITSVQIKELAMKQFAVLGLGSFGYYVAVSLAESGHEIIAIDQDKDKIQAIKNKVTSAVIADVREKKALFQILGPDIDTAIVSLGSEMEASILATLYLKELNIPNRIVKANSEDHGKILMLVGATDVIYPEKDIALKLVRNLTNPNLIDYLPLTEGISFVELAALPDFVGQSIKDLQLRNKYSVEIIAVKNEEKQKMIMVPNANYVIKEGDSLLIIGKEKDISSLTAR